MLKFMKKVFIKLYKISIERLYFYNITKRIKKYKNIHLGERCFIIGNGPSLKANDLEKLKNEYTFATNRIYNMFNETTWRPTYYVAQDFVLIKEIMDSIESKLDDITKKFLVINIYKDYSKKVKENKKNEFFLILFNKNDKKMPKFSNNFSKGEYEGFTVTYACMQLAFYMGFKEIYLLGVDHNYSIFKDINGRVIKTEANDHFNSDEKVDWDKINIPQLDKSTLAYLSAKKFSEKNNFKIYNATRGGKLEVFERKKFDDIDFK